MFRFLTSLIIIVAASLLQISDIFIFGIKPNILLVSLLALSIINNLWIQRIILVLSSVVVLNFYPMISFGSIFDLRLLFFAAIAVLAITLIDYAPWTNLINLSLAVVLSTIILNIYNFDLTSVVLESLYNILLSLLILLVINRFI